VLAGLLNGLTVQGTALEEVVLVVLGAGSSAIGGWAEVMGGPGVCLNGVVVLCWRCWWCGGRGGGGQGHPPLVGGGLEGVAQGTSGGVVVYGWWRGGAGGARGRVLCHSLLTGSKRR
jgi:hypothetical protein